MKAAGSGQNTQQRSLRSKYVQLFTCGFGMQAFLQGISYL